MFTTFGIGALVGVVTAYATQLFDTIKTRAQGVEGAGIGEACQTVIREYGIRGFWKGSSMRLGRLLLSGSILFSVMKRWLLFCLRGQIARSQKNRESCVHSALYGLDNTGLL